MSKWAKDNEKTVEIDYTNWRGVRAVRSIIPVSIWFGDNWHKEQQWLLLALDLKSGEYREFAMCNIHSWKKS